MSVLLIAEMNGSELVPDATGKAVSAVSQLGELHLLVIGENITKAASDAAKFTGVTKVLVADDAVYAGLLAEPVTELLLKLVGDYSHIAAPSTAAAKNILPRFAGKMDVMVLTDVIGLIDPETFSRPIYAGNAIETVRSKDKLKVFTLRTTSFSLAEPQGRAAPVEVVGPSQHSSVRAVWVEDRITSSERPDLTSARIIIAGGRSLGSKENFILIERLADRMGAAVGASRAAVDSGFAPNDWQVGQTGKVVAPELYIAVGISGAIQHLAGMKDSKIIVAINKDEDAPIFQIADYGLVADLFDVLPALTDAV